MTGVVVGWTTYEVAAPPRNWNVPVWPIASVRPSPRILENAFAGLGVVIDTGAVAVRASSVMVRSAVTENCGIATTRAMPVWKS